MDNLVIDSNNKNEIYDILYGTLTCLSILLDVDRIEQRFNRFVPGDFNFFTKDIIADNICKILTHADFNKILTMLEAYMSRTDSNMFSYRLHSARNHLLNKGGAPLTKELIRNIKTGDVDFIRALLKIINEMDIHTSIKCRRIIGTLMQSTQLHFSASSMQTNTYYTCDSDEHGCNNSVCSDSSSESSHHESSVDEDEASIKHRCIRFFSNCTIA